MGCGVSSSSGSSERPSRRAAPEHSASIDGYQPSSPISASMVSLGGTQSSTVQSPALQQSSIAGPGDIQNAATSPSHEIVPSASPACASQDEHPPAEGILSKTGGTSFQRSRVDHGPSSSLSLPKWIVPPVSATTTLPGRMSQSPSGDGFFSLESSSCSISERPGSISERPGSISDRPGSPHRQLTMAPVVHANSPPEVAFSSNSIFVPKEPSISHEIRKRYQGGYVDPVTKVGFLTRTQRYDILCLEIEGKRHPPSGSGLLFTHPSIHHGTPFPLRAFADTMAWTKDLKGLDRITCCEFLADLQSHLSMAAANPSNPRNSDNIDRAVTKAQMFGLVKPQVILLELHTQMTDFRVLESSPSRFMTALKAEDYAELQKAYAEHLNATSFDPDVPQSGSQSLTTFVKCRILQNIQYCELLGSFVASSILDKLQAERVLKREAAKQRVRTG